MIPAQYRKTLKGACSDGLAWARAEGVTSDQEAWARLQRPDWLLWLAVHRGIKLDEGKLRHFSCDCAEQALALVPQPDQRSLEAIAVARLFADGKASQEELDAASDAASAAASAASAAASAASAASDASDASDAAWAASDAAWAASDAAWAAAGAASAAAWAAWAAGAAARAWQADRLRHYFPVGVMA